MVKYSLSKIIGSIDESSIRAIWGGIGKYMPWVREQKQMGQMLSCLSEGVLYRKI